MAIDRVTSSSPTLTIPERIARDQPGRQPLPQAGQPPRETDGFALDTGMPSAVGALLDAVDARLPDGASGPAALAGKLAAQALLDEPLSMQPNQALMSRQLVWQSPEPSVLAASWLAMVRTYAEQRAALIPQTQGRHVPASLFLSEQAGRVLRDGRVPPQLVSELDEWRFAVYAWGTEQLVLRVVTRDPDEEDGPAHQRRRQRVALRLELHLPGLGKVALQMEPADGGVVLEIGAAGPAMRHLRALLPRIGELASRCGVRIARVRLMRELPAPGSRPPTRSQLTQLTPALFNAMAELAVLLSQPQPADELFFEPQR